MGPGGLRCVRSTVAPRGFVVVDILPRRPVCGPDALLLGKDVKGLEIVEASPKNVPEVVEPPVFA